MLSVIDLRGQPAATMTREKLAGVLPRAALGTDAAVEEVRPICEDVRQRGAAAVREYMVCFDGVDLATSRVSAHALAQALAGLRPALWAALVEAIRTTRFVHEVQLPADHGITVADRLLQRSPQRWKK